MGNINFTKGIVAVLGAPASGKTVFAKKLSERLGCYYVNVNQLSLEKGYIIEKDFERDSYVLDEGKVREELLRILEERGCLIVETITPYAIPKDSVAFVVVVRCRPSVLLKRLRERGYSREKVRENLEYEAIDGPLFDAMELAPEERIIEVDGCEGNLDEELERILKFKGSMGRFNWTEDFMTILDEI